MPALLCSCACTWLCGTLSRQYVSVRAPLSTIIQGVHVGHSLMPFCALGQQPDGVGHRLRGAGAGWQPPGGHPDQRGAGAALQGGPGEEPLRRPHLHHARPGGVPGVFQGSFSVAHARDDTGSLVLCIMDAILRLDQRRPVAFALPHWCVLVAWGIQPWYEQNPRHLPVTLRHRGLTVCHSG